MSTRTACLYLAAVAILPAACSKSNDTLHLPGIPIAASDLPQRKAGLWRETVGVTAMNRSADVCSTAGAVAPMPQPGQADCKTSIERTWDKALRIHWMCTTDKGESGMTMTVRGDPASDYTANGENIAVVGGTTVRTPLHMAMKYLGPCP